MKYFAYCRKSTESEDRQLLSIPAQKRELEECAKKNNLKIVEFISESASAYKLGRIEFNKMIKRIQDGEADGILVWAYNRLARNAVDGGAIIYLLDTEDLKEIRTPSSSTNGSGNSKFMLQLEFAMSKKSSDDNSESVKRGNREKILKGWHHRKHLGYQFFESPEHGWEKILIPDQERFEMLQKAIYLVLAGKSVLKVIDMLNNDWGFRTPKTKRMGDKPLGESSFYRILHNEFYCGWLHTSKEEKVKGNHTPMITDEEFDRLQIILADKGKPRPKSVELPYRTQIKCGECGCAVCLEEKHQTICSECKTKFSSKNRNHCISCKTLISEMNEPTRLHYVYGHCTKKKKHVKCSQISIKIDDLEQQMATFLSSIELGPKTEEWVLKQLGKQNKSQISTQDQARKNLLKNFDRKQEEIDALLTSYSSPENKNHDFIEPEEYLAKKKKLKQEKKIIEAKIKDNAGQSDIHTKAVEEKFNFAVTARKKFENGSPVEKTDIITDLGSNLILKDGIITIQQEYPWLFIQRANQELAILKSKGLEPEKSIDEYEKTGASDEVISCLQGQGESNPHQRFWRPLFYR